MNEVWPGESGYGALTNTETFPESQRPHVEITPIRPDYATAPLEKSFDWPDILRQVRTAYNLPPELRTLYLVVFPSKRLPNADEGELAWNDDRAHREAMLSPAFLTYFQGELDDEGNCRSFCLWTDRTEAWEASHGPAHTTAVAITRRMYHPTAPERYLLHETEDGGVECEPVERQVPALD